jgi:hypothetical protein
MRNLKTIRGFAQGSKTRCFELLGREWILLLKAKSHSGMGEDIKKGYKRVNMVEILHTHV